MGLLAIIFIVLFLALTGLWYHLLWVILVVLGAIMVFWILRFLLAIIVAPIVFLIEKVFSCTPVRAVARDPFDGPPPREHPDYWDWANRTGRYSPEGIRIRRLEAQKPKPRPLTPEGLAGVTAPDGHPWPGHPDYLDWANRTGRFK